MAEDSRELDRKLVKSVAWMGAASSAVQVLSWVSTLLVVRLLSPEDYGVFGVVQIYLGLVLLLSEFGIGTAIVTLRELDRRQIAQLNSVTLLLAGLGLLVSWLLAGPISQFFGDVRLRNVLLASSAILPASALVSIASAQIQRDLDFGYLARAQVAHTVVSVATTLGLAFGGAGYWALALGTLAGQVAQSAILLSRAPAHFERPDRSSIGRSIVFSRQVILERIAWYGYAGADRLVVGKLLGEAALGIYSVAQTLGTLAVEKISILVLRVAPGILSVVQHEPAHLRRYLLSMTEALSITTFPVSIGIALVADDIVHVLLGERWVDMIPVLQILGVVGAYQSVTALLTRVLTAVGETRLCMRVAWGTFVILPTSFLIAARFGLTGVAAVWLLIYPITQIPLYLRLRHRIGLSLVDYAKSLWPATSGVLVMSAGVLLLDAWPGHGSLPRILQLVTTVAVGVSLFALTALVLHRERIERFREQLRDLRATSPDPGSELRA